MSTSSGEAELNIVAARMAGVASLQLGTAWPLLSIARGRPAEGS